jgi:hypothetical protein
MTILVGARAGKLFRKIHATTGNSRIRISIWKFGAYPPTKAPQRRPVKAPPASCCHRFLDLLLKIMAHHAQNFDVRQSNFTTVNGNVSNLYLNFSPTSDSHLSRAFSFLNLIAQSVDGVPSSKQQLSVLKCTIKTLLQTLDAEYRAGRLSKTTTVGQHAPLADLER